MAFFDIQDRAAEELTSRLSGDGYPAPRYFHCDLTDVGELQGRVREAVAALGGVSVLVNNAANDQRHAIEEVTAEFWDRSIATNLRPHFFMIQSVLPAMRAAQGGSIINMSSISWMIPSTGLPVYVTAKAAIVGLTRTMAH